MYDQINKEILETKEHLRKRERIQNLIKLAEQKLTEEEGKRLELKEILDREEADVRELEGLGIKSIFLKVLGNKEEKLDKEKKEFLEAKLKYDSCCSSIKLIQEEIENYNGQLRELGYAKYSYEELLTRKEKLILQSNDKYAREIIGFKEEISDLESDKRELKEAIIAGNTVLQTLRNAENSLEKAENWGTWDMLGGGFMSTAAKHSNIDDAVEYINEAKGYLNRFVRELSDVNVNMDISIDISSFDRFADYFFDGLLADWNVQSKIKSSADSVHSAIRRIDVIVSDLEANYRYKERKVEELNRRIKSILENTED